MWKHEIIESLKVSCSTSVEQEYAALMNLLKEAETFYFGNVEDIVDIWNEQAGEDTPLWINTPYPLTLVEWQDHRPTTDPKTPLESPKRAVLIHSQAERRLQTFYDFYYTTVHFIIPHTGENKAITDWFVCPIACECDSEYPWILNWSNSDLDSVFSKEDLDDLILDTNRDFTVARVFLDLLNSKQATLKRDVPAPEKLNAKRFKRGKCPLSSYKVLEVIKSINKQQQKEERQYAVERIYEGVREHTVRAHEKTYTKEKPLFGKYVGTFKWKAQKRGDKTLGTIEKEYSVTIDKSRNDDGE